jgi:two-component system response regulator GlrR
VGLLGLKGRTVLKSGVVAQDPASVTQWIPGLHRTQSPASYGQLLGSSPKMLELFATLARLEHSLVNILIQGESGSGKELVGCELHERSRLADGPFVAVNCGALDRALARSELFGHRRGAFTGAVDTHVGAFEAADGGTLLLDEIGDLPLDVQPTLLRAIQNKAIVRLGENSERPVRVRVIAASHHNLWNDVRAGRFREDLYFRLAVVKLCVPPLRERSGDVELLAQHFASEIGLAPLPDSVIEALRKRDLPGNVRELFNLVEHYGALGTLPPSQEPVDIAVERMLEATIDVCRPYVEQKQELVGWFQRAYFRKLIAHTAGNQSRAARLAGIERSYLSKLVKRLPDDCEPCPES